MWVNVLALCSGLRQLKRSDHYAPKFEFSFFKVNEFEFSFFKVNEFKFKN